MRRTLTATLLVLTLSTPALAGPVPQGVTLRAYEPVGNGDPNAISCWARRVTPPIRGLQCARNSEWKRVNGGGSLAGRAGIDAAFLGQTQPNWVSNNSMGFSAVGAPQQHTPLP